MTLSITRRNQANAQHSTGPKSEDGKARSSQNARAHGATAAPSPSHVAAWLRVILNKDTLEEHDLKPITRVGRCALELATAEARLAITEQARRDRGEEDWQAKTLGSLVRELSKNLSIICDGPPTGRGRKILSPEERQLEVFNAAERLKLAVDTVEADKHRLTWRYHREAHATRRRALNAWGSALKEDYDSRQRRTGEAEIPKRTQTHA